MDYTDVIVKIEARIPSGPTPSCDDAEDRGRQAWDELKAEVRKLVDDPRFASIFPEIYYEI